MRICATLAFGAALSIGGVEAYADCNPRDFMIQDVIEIKKSIETEIAFVLTATEQEYNRAKKEGGASGGYGLITGGLSYGEAQEKARSIAQAIRFDYKSSYAYSFLAQTLSGKAMDAYVTCIEKDKEKPGLALWLQKREGDYFRFRAFWVGADGKVGAAKWDAQPAVDGGRMVSKPDAWLKGKTEEIVVKRDGNNDLFLDLKVGGETKSAVIVKDPPTVVWKTQPVLSPLLLKASSSGPNPGCKAGSVTDCITPLRPGGTFVPKSMTMTEGSTTELGQYGQVFYIDTPAQICVRMSQSTSACDVTQSAQGRLRALETYPQALE